MVSPKNARDQLSAFIKGARRELLIYDANVSDDRNHRDPDAARRRRREGQFWPLEEKWKDTGVKVKSLRGLRLHVGAIVRDRKAASVGSQSLRKLELISAGKSE